MDFTWTEKLLLICLLNFNMFAQNQPTTSAADLVMPIMTPITTPATSNGTVSDVSPQQTSLLTATSLSGSTHPSIFQNDINEINQDLNSLALLKKTLKDNVREMNDKLLDARKKTIETQKFGFEVIQKTRIESERVLSQASLDLQKLQDLQKNIQTDLFPKFQENAKKIEQLINKIECKIADLQTKGLKFQVEQSQQNTPVLTAKTGVSPFGSAIPSKDMPITQEKALYLKILDWSTNAFVSTVDFVYKKWNYFWKWAWGK